MEIIKNPALQPAEPRYCLCGCGARVGDRSDYRRGHDARHVQQLRHDILSGVLTIDGAADQLSPVLYAKLLRTLHRELETAARKAHREAQDMARRQREALQAASPRKAPRKTPGRRPRRAVA